MPGENKLALALSTNLKDKEFLRDLDGLTNVTEQMNWPRNERGAVDDAVLRDYHKKDSGIRFVPYKVMLTIV
jgi:hypothetical protein